MATWPASLPQRPSFFDESFADTSIRTSMDVGPVKTRKRTSVGSKPGQVTFSGMTSTQVDILETFYKETLGSGTLPYDWLHPRTGLNKSWLFTGPPKIKRMGRTLKYYADFGLEELP